MRSFHFTWTVLLSPLFILCIAQRWEVQDVVFVVVSQPNPYDTSLAVDVRNSIHEQAKDLKQGLPIVHLTHEEFHHPGVWTILPFIPRLETLHGKNSSFIFFLQSGTHVDLTRLMELLRKFDPRQERWIGYALSDRDATIIHHFALPKNPGGFKYPSFASGFIISRSLLKRLAQRLKNGDLPKHAEFSIDASYELALYVWDEGRGTVLTHSDSLCVRPGPHCVTRPKVFQACGEPVPHGEIYFAVKTCSKFHQDRLPVVKNTWAKQAKRIGFFSDVEDSTLSTINLGVPNTERGHCGKTMAILRYAAKQSVIDPRIKWVVVADDDTILSVGRLQQLLSCYDPSDLLAIGERYGYNVALPRSVGGYNYITGGGGMVFSIRLVLELAKAGGCICPSDSTPDDMYLGICLANHEVPIIHSPLFHQARPSDYAADYLTPQLPVSFHKHWMVDPYQVYNDWFKHIDSQVSSSQAPTHGEL